MMVTMHPCDAPSLQRMVTMTEFFLATNGGHISGRNLSNQQDLINDLKKAREENGISLEKAADMLGIKASLLEAVEGFRVELSLTDLRQYAYACGAVIEYSVAKV